MREHLHAHAHLLMCEPACVWHIDGCMCEEQFGVNHSTCTYLLGDQSLEKFGSTPGQHLPVKRQRTWSSSSLSPAFPGHYERMSQKNRTRRTLGKQQSISKAKKTIGKAQKDFANVPTRLSLSHIYHLKLLLCEAYAELTNYERSALLNSERSRTNKRDVNCNGRSRDLRA